MDRRHVNATSLSALLVVGLAFPVGAFAQVVAPPPALEAPAPPPPPALEPLAPPEPTVPEQPVEPPAPEQPVPPPEPTMALPVAPVPPPPAPVAAPAAAPAPFPVSLMIITGHSVGEGTFSWNKYVRNPYYAWSGSIRPKLKLPFGFAVALRQDVDLEWTKSESTTYDKQPILADPRMGIRYEGLKFPVLGLSFMVYGGMRAPVSLESRYRRQLGAVDLVGNVDWSKWGFHVMLGLGLQGIARIRGKTVHDNSLMSQWWGSDNEARAYTDRNGQRIVPMRCIGRSGELASGGCPSTGAANGSFGQLTTTAVVGYDFATLTPVPISIEASLLTVHSVSDYIGPNDQYTGLHANVGFQRRDLTWGSISLAYQMFDWLSLDVGTSSLQPLMYSTNQYPRFPFWNIPYWDLANMQRYAGANNFSSLSGGATFTW